MKSKALPFIICPNHGKYYSFDGSFFDQHKIRNIPRFIVVAKAFLLGLGVESVASLFGMKEETVSRFCQLIRNTMTAKISSDVEKGVFKMGGNGKTVEIDECICSSRKYMKGRPVNKGDMLIVGLFEVPTAEAIIQDDDMLGFIKWKEKSRVQREAAKKAQRNKKPKRTTKKKTLNCFKRASGRFQVVNGLDDSFPFQVNPLLANRRVQLERVGAERVNFKELQARTDELFCQAKGSSRRKALFFLVERRTQAVLEDIIKKNVVGGSSVMTDEWAGYNHLRDAGFDHDTVCHKYHFSRFIVAGNKVRRVTTNHVEREWVELRKRIRYMPRERAAQCLSLETYRLFYLNGPHSSQVSTLLHHISETLMNNTDTPNDETPSLLPEQQSLIILDPHLDSHPPSMLE